MQYPGQYQSLPLPRSPRVDFALGLTAHLHHLPSRISFLAYPSPLFVCRTLPRTVIRPPKFPPALSNKIRRQYRYIFKEVSVFDNTEIVDVMPGVMSTSLLYAQHRAVAKGVGFLAKRPPVLVCRLLRRMVPSFATVRDREGPRMAREEFGKKERRICTAGTLIMRSVRATVVKQGVSTVGRRHIPLFPVK